MKRIPLMLICTSLLLSSLFLCSCLNEDKYESPYEFYFKTSPADGDMGVTEVISLEAEHSTYFGDGDVTVTMEIGLGHLPGIGGYGEEVEDRFYVLYRIIETPWSADAAPAWKKRVDYNESWYSPKFNSTEQEDIPNFIFPRYGEFFPIYKEKVDIVFPADVEKGYLEIWLCSTAEGWEADQRFFSASIDFTHKNGELKLEQ